MVIPEVAAILDKSPERKSVVLFGIEVSIPYYTYIMFSSNIVHILSGVHNESALKRVRTLIMDS